MSYDSTAILFYGFVTEEDDEERANKAGDRDDVTIGSYGDCHGDMGVYVAHKQSERKVELGGTVQVYPEEDRLLSWDDDLKGFCEQAGIDWPNEGVGWYLTVERS